MGPRAGPLLARVGSALLRQTMRAPPCCEGRGPNGGSERRGPPAINPYRTSSAKWRASQTDTSSDSYLFRSQFSSIRRRAASRGRRRLTSPKSSAADKPGKSGRAGPPVGPVRGDRGCCRARTRAALERPRLSRGRPSGPPKSSPGGPRNPQPRPPWKRDGGGGPELPRSRACVIPRFGSGAGSVACRAAARGFFGVGGIGSSDSGGPVKGRAPQRGPGRLASCPPAEI